MKKSSVNKKVLNTTTTKVSTNSVLDNGLYIVHNTSVVVDSGKVYMSISKRGSVLTPNEEIMIDTLTSQCMYPVKSIVNLTGVGLVDSYYVMSYTKFRSLIGEDNKSHLTRLSLLSY